MNTSHTPAHNTPAHNTPAHNTPAPDVPGWVKLALAGVPGRGSAIAMYWIAFAMGSVAFVLALVGFGGWMMGLASAVGFATAVLAQQSIKTMDARNAWGRRNGG